MLVEIVFSPTGGTKKAADILADAIGNVSKVIDICDRQTDCSEISLEREDVAVIAVPSYGGRVPSAAAQRLAQIKGNGARAALLCAYGNRAYDDTLAELADIAVKAGFSVVAAVAAVAEHSIARQYAKGRPNQVDRQALTIFGAQIAAKLTSGDTSVLAIPGKVPERPAKNMGFVPKVRGGCTNCGLCARKCPTGAIDPSDVRSTDKSRCISCMACVSVCPAHVRGLNGFLTTAASLMLKKECSKYKDNELFI